MSSGSHDIYLTGNYVFPANFDEEDDDEDYEQDGLDYDLSPDEDELDISDSEEDELDQLEDPRITEVESEEEAPALVAATIKKEKKGKNKRPAENEDEPSLDDLISKATKAAPATNGEKKQAKKLKNNEGQAVAAAQESVKKEQKEAPSSDKKKVQFSKNLEMGPTGSPKVEDIKKEAKKDEPKSGPRTVQGVIIDDKKVGKGKAAKKGDKVEMRYIGKLKSNGKQFDGESILSMNMLKLWH
jgi:FK506-binding nuclear protein